MPAGREPLWIHPADGGGCFSLDFTKRGSSSQASVRQRLRLSRRPPNRLLEPIHNRMPVILEEAGAADWMNWREPDPLSLKRLLVPAPDDLRK